MLTQLQAKDIPATSSSEPSESRECSRFVTIRYPRQRDKIQAGREIEATNTSIDDAAPRARSRETTIDQREREDEIVDTSMDNTRPRETVAEAEDRNRGPEKDVASGASREVDPSYRLSQLQYSPDLQQC